MKTKIIKFTPEDLELIRVGKKSIKELSTYKEAWTESHCKLKLSTISIKTPKNGNPYIELSWPYDNEDIIKKWENLNFKTPEEEFEEEFKKFQNEFKEFEYTSFSITRKILEPISEEDSLVALKILIEQEKKYKERVHRLKKKKSNSKKNTLKSKRTKILALK